MTRAAITYIYGCGLFQHCTLCATRSASTYIVLLSGRATVKQFHFQPNKQTKKIQSHVKRFRLIYSNKHSSCEILECLTIFDAIVNGVRRRGLALWFRIWGWYDKLIAFGMVNVPRSNFSVHATAMCNFVNVILFSYLLLFFCMICCVFFNFQNRT